MTLLTHLRKSELPNHVFMKLQHIGYQIGFETGVQGPGGCMASVGFSLDESKTPAGERICDLQINISDFSNLEVEPRNLAGLSLASGKPVAWAMSGFGRATLSSRLGELVGVKWMENQEFHEDNRRALGILLTGTFKSLLEFNKSKPILLMLDEANIDKNTYHFMFAAECGAEIWQALYNLRNAEIQAATVHFAQAAGVVAAKLDSDDLGAGRVLN